MEAVSTVPHDTVVLVQVKNTLWARGNNAAPEGGVKRTAASHSCIHPAAISEPRRFNWLTRAFWHHGVGGGGV